MNLTRACSHLLLSKGIPQVQVINPNFKVVFHINDYFSSQTKFWVIGLCMVWFGSLWSSALGALSVWKSGASDLCYFGVNLLLGLVVRKDPGQVK